MALQISELKDLGRERFLAVLSDGRETRVSTAMIADLALYSGRELAEEEQEMLFSASALLECKERALRIIGARPMSCKELHKKLLEKGESEEAAESCIEWLLERRYLDDGQYAAMLVRHYNAKGYGIARVKQELYRRGIAKSLWDEALEDMPEMDDKVFELLCRKLKTDAPDRAEMKRATDSLFRRGYSWDEIKTAVNRFNDGVAGRD